MTEQFNVGGGGGGGGRGGGGGGGGEGERLNTITVLTGIFVNLYIKKGEKASQNWKSLTLRRNLYHSLNDMNSVPNALMLNKNITLTTCSDNINITGIW